MGAYAKFAAIFRTTIVQGGSKKIISDPVKIEVFRGSRSFRVPVQLSRIIPAGQDSVISRGATLVLSDEHAFISLIVRIRESDDSKARRTCEEEIDQAVTDLSIIYSPTIFCELVYRGWIQELEDDRIISDAWVKFGNRIEIDERELSHSLRSLRKQHLSDPDIKDRFKLMSRFFSKAIMLSPSEEQFLLFWTVLEVFPMKDTTNIKPIGEYLSTILGKTATEVKDKLEIGRLFGLRSDLVHNGKLNLDSKHTGEIFTKLEDICYETLRNISGLPYSGALDKYF